MDNPYTVQPPKKQRFCFEFPPIDFRNMSKIILDLNDFSTKMEQIWNGNYELSRYQYPIISRIDEYRKVVYFVCKAQNEGCKFCIKLKYQITKLNEPCASIKQVNLKLVLGQFIDMKKVGVDDQIHFYKAYCFKVMHNHATMPAKMSKIQSYKVFKQKQSKYNIQKHNFSKVFDHYRRRSQRQSKRLNRNNNYNTGIENEMDSGQNQGSPHNIMEEINGQLDLMKKQLQKNKKDEQKLHNELFNDKVIFICEYEDKFKPKQIQNNQKIAQNKDQQFLNSSVNETLNNQINDKSSEDSFKGEPCLYFYSSLSMQKNLSNFPQIVNVIVLKSHSFQFSQNKIEKLHRRTNYKYVFCSVANGKECLIFAVAFVCLVSHSAEIKRSIIEKFFSLSNSNKIQTMILTHFDTEMLQIVENVNNSQGRNKIRCIFRIPFCHEARNTCVSMSSLGSDIKHNKIARFYCQTTHFVGQFTQAVLQYFYNISKQFQGLKSNQSEKHKKNISTISQQKSGDRYPFQDLYYVLAFRIQEILMKMYLTLNPEAFSIYLLDFMNQFCFSDYLIMLIHEKLIKYKDRIFLSQMPIQKRTFIGTNLYLNLEGCIGKYFYVSNHNNNNLGIINTVSSYKNSPVSLSNEKIFKILITQANKNNAQFPTWGKYWIQNLQYFNNQQQFHHTVESLAARDNKQQKKRNQTEYMLLKKYQCLQKLIKKKQMDSAMPTNVLSTKQVQEKLKRERQSRNKIMKRLPYYNQSCLYMSETSRQYIFDRQIISMLEFSIIDFSDRNIIVTKGETLIDVCVITWNQNQIHTVRRSKDTEGVWACSCGFMELMRMPCRHILKVMMKYQCNMISSVNEYWFKK